MVEQRLYIPEPPAGLRACRNPTSTPCVLTTPSEVMRRSRCDSSRCLIASGSEDASMAKRRCTALETLLPYSQTQSAARSRRPVPAPQRSARHHRTVRRCGRSVHGALNFVAITGSRESQRSTALPEPQVPTAAPRASHVSEDRRSQRIGTWRHDDVRCHFRLSDDVPNLPMLTNRIA